MYCSYCSLPKPSRGFASAVEETPEEIAPSDQPRPALSFRAPRERKKASKEKAFTENERNVRRTAVRSSKRPGKEPRKLRLPVVSVAAFVAFLSVAIYIFVVPLVYSDQAEPKTVLAALDQLKHMPSSQDGLNIDTRLAHELETSKRVGNLVAYQGWSIKHIKGTKAEVLLVFSFDEVDKVHQQAEWVANLNASTFTPKTDLAISVSRK